MTAEQKLQTRLFRVTVKIIEKHGIPYWLESGTLLGVVRNARQEGGPGDRNIEIGIPGEYGAELMALSRKFAPFYRLKELPDLSGRNWIEGDIARIIILHMLQRIGTALQVLVTLKFKKAEKYRWVDGRSCKWVDAAYFDRLEGLNIAGREYFIPSGAEDYLADRYGNWRVPKAAWISGIDDLAIVEERVIKQVPHKRVVQNRSIRKIQLHEGNYREQMKEMLFFTIDILEKNGIPYWLTAGTLLGVLRDDDLIPWDYDADLGIPGEYGPQVLRLWHQFLPKYMIRKRFKNGPWLPERLRAIKIKKTWEKVRRISFQVDIFCVYRVGDSFRWIDSGALKEVPKRFHDQSDAITWEGRTVYIPARAEEYLSIRYGNWKVPDRAFDSGNQDGSIAEKGF